MQKTSFLNYLKAVLVCFSLSTTFSYACEYGAEVIINLRHLPSEASEQDGGPRSTSIDAYYDSDYNSVIAILGSMGPLVDVYIENLDTEEQIYYQISGNGNAILPISGSSGNWTITFLLSNGDEYVGEFYL